MKSKEKEIYSKFGANERALVDKIKSHTIRNVVIRLIGMKLKLQWTGWLQYLIPLPISLALLLLAFIASIFGGLYISIVLSAFGLFLLLKVLFDIITVKYKFRAPEKRPKRQDEISIFDLMRKRHSCRSYQTKKLEKEDYNELMESVNKQMKEPKFSSKKIRIEYISKPITVWPVVNATEFLVAIAPKTYDRLAIIDVGRTLQNIVIDASRMGLGTCWIGPGADHNSITTALGNRFNPDKDNIICISALGYESRYKPLFIRIFNKNMRNRLPISSLFFNSYEMKESININQHPYKRFMQLFESCQWAPSSYNGQTPRGVIFTENNEFNRIDFLASTSSRYYAAVASGIWCANWELGCNEIKLNGEFKKLNESEVNLTEKQKNQDVPVYDISWVISNSAIEE